jgi:hydroxymethylbilane synthase
MKKKIIVGSRGSQLALTQTQQFVDMVKKANPGLEVEIQCIVTAGDREQHKQWDAVEGTGVFVKELESALLDGRIDFAVHSLKDMPAEVTSGLCLAAVTERADPRDVLIAAGGKKLKDLPPGATIGTGSPRRTIQLKAFRPDLVPFPIRGNVDTRVRKATSGELNGVIIAAAGLGRLGWADRISEYLPVDQFLPAVGQGALAIETRCDDSETAALLRQFNHPDTERSVAAERALLRALGGGCRAPIAALGMVANSKLKLLAMYADPDGSNLVTASAAGNAGDAEQIGTQLAKKLLEIRKNIAASPTILMVSRSLEQKEGETTHDLWDGRD